MISQLGMQRSEIDRVMGRCDLERGKRRRRELREERGLSRERTRNDAMRQDRHTRGWKWVVKNVKRSKKIFRGITEYGFSRSITDDTVACEFDRYRDYRNYCCYANHSKKFKCNGILSETHSTTVTNSILPLSSSLQR